MLLSLITTVVGGWNGYRTVLVSLKNIYFFQWLIKKPFYTKFFLFINWIFSHCKYPNVIDRFKSAYFVDIQLRAT